MPSVALPQQPPAESVGANNAVPWALGVRVDLVRELLKNVLSSEDYAKYSAQLEPPKREEPTIYQDLANKFKEHCKVLSQVGRHRNVVRDAQLKLQKHEEILKELQDRSQSLQQEINSLQEQADAAKAASDSVLPPMLPPSFPPEDAPAKNTDDLSGVQIQEIHEGDEEMEEVEEEVRCGNLRNHDPIAPGPIIGPTGRAPQRVLRTRLSGVTVARIRLLVNMCLLWLCHSSLQLKVLEPIMLFRGLQVCVLTWYESY